MAEHELPSKPHLKGLTGPQRLFVVLLAADPQANATAAAREAGCSAKSAHVTACKWLKQAKVSKALDAERSAREERIEIKGDRVLLELYRIGTLDLRKVFNADWTMKPLDQIPDDAVAAIASINVDELIRRKDQIVVEQHSEQLALLAESASRDEAAARNSSRIGQVKTVKFHDKIHALELLGQHLKLFTQKVEVSGRSPEDILAESFETTKKEPKK